MCGIYGCGCKEVYRFPHISYLSLLLLYLLFWQQHPYFFVHFLMFFVLVPVLFCNLCNFFAHYFIHTMLVCMRGVAK